MADIFKLQGEVSVETGKAEAGLRRLEGGAGKARDAMGRFLPAGKNAGNAIAGGFDRGVQSASRLSSVVSSLQSKINSMRGASVKFGSSGGGSGGSPGIGDIVGGNLLSGAISSAVGAVGGAMKQGWQIGIEYQKVLENAAVRMDRFFQSSKQTGAFVTSVEKFAALSPVFEMEEAVTGAQRLLQMKYSAAEVVPELAKIGDIVGGVGGNAQTIDRVTLAMNQMVSTGKIQADEMGQLTEANIPAWELLAKAIGKTEAETRKLVEGGRIDAKLGVRGIIAAGGDMFKGQSDKAAQTLSGRESQAKSALEMQLAQATKGNFGQLKAAYGQVATGLGTSEAGKMAQQLDGALTDIGKSFEPILKGVASGEYFMQGFNAITAGRGAVDAYQKGETGKAANFAGQAVGSSLGMKYGKEGEDQTVDAIIGKMDGLDKSLAAPVIRGITGAMNAVEPLARKAGEFVGLSTGEGVKAGTENSLQIKSPSRVMMGLGEQAAEGFVIGFENGKKKIQPITAEDLYRKQYERADKAGYDDAFKKAAEKTGLPQELLMGIGSRETNMRNIIGDGGRGAGLMQVDIGTDAAFKASGAWKDAEASIIRGAEILKEKFDWLTENAGKTVSVKGNKFTVPKLEGEEKMRTAVAMYNSGAWAPYHVSKGRSADYGTTGKDYSADVLKRTEYFKELLGSATETKPAVDSVSSALDTAKQKFLEFGASVINWTGIASTATAKPSGPSVGKVLPRGTDGAQAKPYTGQIGVGSVGSAEIKSGPDKITLSKDAETAGKSLTGLGVSAKQVSAPITEATKAITTTAQAATDSTFKVGDYAKAIMETGSAAKEAIDHFARFKDSFADGIDDLIENGFSKDGLKSIGKNLLRDLSGGLISQATGGKASSVGGLLSNALFGGLGKGGAGNVAASLPGGFAGGANPAAAATGGGSGGGIGGMASKASDLLSNGKGIGGMLGKLPGAAKVGGFLTKLPGVGGILGKLGGLFGMGGGGAAGAAGAAAGAGGMLGKISGALGFAGPWGMVAGIGLQFAAPLLGKLFGGNPLKDYKKLVQGEYGVKISDQMAGKILQIGESKFGQEAPKRKIETVRLPEVRDMLSEYAGAFRKGGNNKLFSGAEIGDQYSAMNQFKVPMMANGGFLNAGGLAIVGERGPELFAAPSAGRVIPNGAGMGGGMEAMGDMLDRLASALNRFQSMPADQVVMTGARSNPDIITDAVDRSLGSRSDSAVRMRDKLQYR